MITRLICVLLGFVLGFEFGCVFVYITDHTDWKKGGKDDSNKH